ncbi:WYL domain-containing protein [Roseateles flavus]|uniref:WYL domain-containing protein n=1 Tax=Roseateles flavus TaxID=3149041 RepID=A0ABV0GLJ1_9BURK
MDAHSSPKPSPSLEVLTRAQRERLSHIDFTLLFLGELRRADVISKFETAPAGVTRDIAMYRALAPDNLEFDSAGKLYRPSPKFKPLFDHPPLRALATLSQGFSQIEEEKGSQVIPCEFPSTLSAPSVDVLAPITRAIHRGKAVSLTYHSVSSGATRRELVPLALVDNGVRWHVRAFDRLKQHFTDFVPTRMEGVEVLETSPVGREERADQDVQWSRIIELKLVPHPNHPRPEIVLMDYPMRDGVLTVRVRSANVGYMLRRWNVDCSPDHHLRGLEYMLWLQDPLSLYGSPNATIAPGYQDPKVQLTKQNTEASATGAS